METFEVTQDHIDRGHPVEAASCPVALAIRERYPSVMVDGTEAGYGAYYGYSDERWVTLPEDVRWFVREFDSGKPVEPISFEIEIPAMWKPR